MIKQKKISIKKIEKTLDSTELTRQTCDIGHETKITIKKRNHNKL